jgi:hypothetical protein
MALLAERHTFISDKKCAEKDARDGSSLANLCPTGRVVPYRWLVGITSPKKQGPHTLFKVVGLMARLPCCPAMSGRLALLTCGLGPTYSEWGVVQHGW